MSNHYKLFFGHIKEIRVILQSTYGAKSQDGIDVGVVFLDFLSEPHSLIIFLGVDVFRPSAFKVVHSLAHVLGSQSIDLFSKIGVKV